MLQHDICDVLKVVVHDIGEVFGLQSLSRLSKADDVGKIDGEFLAFGTDPSLLPAFENRLVDLRGQILGQLRGQLFEQLVLFRKRGL